MQRNLMRKLLSCFKVKWNEIMRLGPPFEKRSFLMLCLGLLERPFPLMMMMMMMKKKKKKKIMWKRMTKKRMMRMRMRKAIKKMLNNTSEDGSEKIYRREVSEAAQNRNSCCDCVAETAKYIDFIYLLFVCLFSYMFSLKLHSARKTIDIFEQAVQWFVIRQFSCFMNLKF